MDIDGPSLTSAEANGEIDQNLLLQFSCMNTNDREELVSQMQRLLGPNMSYNTASFFLDMSNWNLQAAVCCYLDYTLPPKFPPMSVKSTSSPETALSPGAVFEQSWTIINIGTEAWPSYCRLIQVDGPSLNAPPYYVPPLTPGNSTKITMQLTAPINPGAYRCSFHLVTSKNEQVDETITLDIIVESESTMELVEQLAALPIPSSRTEEAVSSNVSQMTLQDDQMC